MSMDVGFTKFSKKDLVTWGISVFLTAACLVVPEQGIYTHNVKLFLAITVFCLSLAAFELVPNLVDGAVCLQLSSRY